MVNKIILIGRIGGKPSVHYMPDGTAVCNFSIATSETWKKDGEKKEKTEWHKVVAYGKLAEICTEYLDKGSLVYVEGKIQSRSWDDKDGAKRTITEVIAGNMKMLDGKKPQETAPDDCPF